MPSHLELARSIVAASRYLTLATADAAGHPWATPVFFAPGGPGEFLWVSRPGAAHSRNLDARPEVSLALFDSAQTIGTGRGLYVAAHAERTDDGVDAFSAASVRWGGRTWDASDVSADSPFRLYRAVATAAWVMDSANDPRGDLRHEVILS